MKGRSVRAMAICGACFAMVAVACAGSNRGSGFGGTNDDGGIFGSSGGPGLEDGGGGPVIGLDAACASESSQAQLQPLDIYVMLDQSDSMNEAVASGGTKWNAVSAALKAFVNQPSLAGVGVGLQYFAVSENAATCPAHCTDSSQCPGGVCAPFLGFCICGGGGDSCNASDYERAEIEIAPLPDVGPKIGASIDAHSPRTGTPTSAALKGAIDHAKSWAQAHGHTTVVVFATDGEPSECAPLDLPSINAIAAQGASGSPKVATFVIGVGKSLSNLNGIAAAGGSGHAFLVDTGGNAQQQFLDALNQIRGAALGCQYTIPTPKSGSSLDFGTVNVQYTPGDGSPPTVLPKVEDKAHCPASGDAWYYDDNSKPAEILLCDSSCSRITADKSGSLTIVIGCGTVVR